MRTAAAEVTETGATRRRFYLGVIYSLWGIISAALALPAFVYLLFPPRARHEDEWVEAGDISKLDPKIPIEMVFRRNRVDGWKLISEKSTAWVAKLASGQVVAYGPQCTHLGCAYHWDESKTEFICPCHSSIFSVDGKVVAGPAPRPLDRFEVRVEGNKLKLGRLLESPENSKA
jgi:menaquinol-cytochrome c reductase iron-sulfur subunit